MTTIELRILKALQDGEDISFYRIQKRALHNLKNLGYISCIFDEQGELITTPHITSLGKKVVSQRQLFVILHTANKRMFCV